jgi:uracil-DNA glycosylase family 4
VGEAVRGGPVAPGTGWPDDPADAATPVAASPADVRSLAAGSAGLAELTARQSVCRACPRLVAWREDVAAVRRKSFMDEPYWGRPIPGWGDPEPAILILGLAPAAHGGNRTGRIFTGDRSGDFLFASLHRCGLAAKPTSVTAGDGQRLAGVRMAAAVRCAPPDNKPLPEERDACAPWLAAEFQLITPTLRVVVCLGGFAWQALWPALAECGYQAPRPRPAFGHGVQVRVSGPGARPLLLLGCYHPSQQNTFTGRVTPAMTDAIFQVAREAAGLGLGADSADGRSAPAEGHVGDAARAAHGLDPELVVKRLKPVPQPLTAPEHDGYHDDVQVVDQAGGQELADGGRAASDADVRPGRCLTRLRERLGGAGVEEVKRGPALHLDRGPGMTGEDENRGAERRRVSPPPVPFLIRPGAMLRAELAPPHDLRADARSPGAREGVVDASAAAGLPLHSAERAGREEPLVQPGPRVPERGIQALPVAGAEPVQRYREIVHPH